jgi:tRNA A37 threonylcarbamoyladenosine biosynthesis protein TsaE
MRNQVRALGSLHSNKSPLYTLMLPYTEGQMCNVCRYADEKDDTDFGVVRIYC